MFVFSAREYLFDSKDIYMLHDIYFIYFITFKDIIFLLFFRMLFGLPPKTLVKQCLTSTWTIKVTNRF